MLDDFSLASFLHPNKESWNSFMDWGGPSWFAFYVGNIRMVLENSPPPIFSFFPLWSLQVEEQYYLIFPAVVRFTTARSLQIILWVCVALALLLRIGSILILPEYSSLMNYVSTPSRMDGLAVGGLLAIYLRTSANVIDVKAIRRLCLILISCCSFLFILVSPIAYNPVVQTLGYTLVDFTFACIVLLILRSPQGAFAEFLRTPLFVKTGQIAYGLYILHAPVGWAIGLVIGKYLGIDPKGAAASLLMAIATYAIASASWTFFESPILRLKDKWAPVRAA